MRISDFLGPFTVKDFSAWQIAHQDELENPIYCAGTPFDDEFGIVSPFLDITNKMDDIGYKDACRLYGKESVDGFIKHVKDYLDKLLRKSRKNKGVVPLHHRRRDRYSSSWAQRFLYSAKSERGRCLLESAPEGMGRISEKEQRSIYGNYRNGRYCYVCILCHMVCFRESIHRGYYRQKR